MMKRFDRNNQLKEIQSQDGDAAGKILGNAWKGLTESQREDYDARVMEMKVNILNSDEGKEALRRVCIDELTVLQDVFLVQVNA